FLTQRRLRRAGVEVILVAGSVVNAVEQLLQVERGVGVALRSSRARNPGLRFLSGTSSGAWAAMAAPASGEPRRVLLTPSGEKQCFLALWRCCVDSAWRPQSVSGNERPVGTSANSDGASVEA